jgi:hypothetical protein
MVGVTLMTFEQFERERSCGVTMAVARVMLRGRVINRRDYRKIDTMFRKKYRPIIGALQA